MNLPILPTTIVGSYPQPDWLVDHHVLRSEGPPRVRMTKVWRMAGKELRRGQDEATRLAVKDMEEAGLDVVTDGEQRRESYFNHFATALSGVDLDNPGKMPDRVGNLIPVPRVVGPIQREQPVEVENAKFLKAITNRPIKITVPGPFTMAQLAYDDHYGDEERLIMAYADAVNAELKDLKGVGCDVVQIDEPYMQAQPDKARKYGVAGIDRALAGIDGPTVVHMCFGYAYVVKEKPSGYSFLPELERSSADQISIEAAQPRLDPSILAELPSKTIMLGVLDLEDPEIESADTVAARVRRALAHVPAERLVLAPDCGMKYIPRDRAFGKLKAMADAAQRLRAEL